MAAVNKHIQTFMKRHEPIPAGSTLPPRVQIKEEDSMINYPKDIRGTILLKNISMRMAVPSGDAPTPMPKVDVHGRLKSDITENKEKIYERSYY